MSNGDQSQLLTKNKRKATYSTYFHTRDEISSKEYYFKADGVFEKKYGFLNLILTGIDWILSIAI